MQLLKPEQHDNIQLLFSTNIQDMKKEAKIPEKLRKEQLRQSAQIC